MIKSIWNSLILLTFSFTLIYTLHSLGGLNISDKNKQEAQANNPSIDFVKIQDSKIILTGSKLNSINGVRIKGANLDHLLQIVHIDGNQIEVKALESMQLFSGQIYNFVINSRFGNNEFSLTFLFPEKDVSLAKLKKSEPILKWDGDHWVSTHL